MYTRTLRREQSDIHLRLKPNGEEERLSPPHPPSSPTRASAAIHAFADRYAFRRPCPVSLAPDKIYRTNVYRRASFPSSTVARWPRRAVARVGHRAAASSVPFKHAFFSSKSEEIFFSSPLFRRKQKKWENREWNTRLFQGGEQWIVAVRNDIYFYYRNV